MLTVVKVGGGLAREAGPRVLRALCAQIAEAGARHPLLVVPGGAQFADVVRAHDRRFTLRPQTAHWMAILAMDQFGWALSDLIPGAARCADLGSVRDPGVSILLPAALLAEHDPLPESWTVTSDSIAAWVAGAVGAERLVLVKAVAGLYRTWPRAGRPIPRLTVDELAALAPRGGRRVSAGGAASGGRRDVGHRRPGPGAAVRAARRGPHGRDAGDRVGALRRARVRGGGVRRRTCR